MVDRANDMLLQLRIAIDLTCSGAVAAPITEIEKQACKALKVSAKDIHSTSRAQKTVNARYMIFWLLHKAGYSYPVIGGRYKRKHSTALYGVKVINSALEVGDKSIVSLYAQVKDILK